MKKQELIEKLNEAIEEVKIKEVSFFESNAVNLEAQMTSIIFGLQYARNLASQLDEPQKVKVPAFVAEWFEKNSRKLEEAVYQLNVSIEHTDEQYWGDMFRWADNPENKPIETLIRMLDGYEVEEEPKWKIINDQKYCLTSIEAGYGNSLHWAFDSTKKKPILFDNEETALYTAYITGGTVEKV